MEPFFIWTAIILSLPFIASGPKTTVTLLDNNSSHNAVDVTTDAGAVSVDQPYYFTTLTSADSKPSVVEKGDPDAIRKKYSDILDALPLASESMLFYFEPGTSELTEESKLQIDALISVIALHSPAVVDIIGHTDRVGDADKNYILSLERARSVEKYLIERHVVLERSNVLSYGENDPIIKTEDGVAEPKNRRVEVIVR